uniref:Uncharacterized protein n=1 Tax=Aegilops tauschii subsp. strangulata TaxID=200361 RepID=A0A453SFW8_AEGTS
FWHDVLFALITFKVKALAEGFILDTCTVLLAEDVIQPLTVDLRMSNFFLYTTLNHLQH